MTDRENEWYKENDRTVYETMIKKKDTDRKNDRINNDRNFNIQSKSWHRHILISSERESWLVSIF